MRLDGAFPDPRSGCGVEADKIVNAARAEGVEAAGDDGEGRVAAVDSLIPKDLRPGGKEVQVLVEGAIVIRAAKAGPVMVLARRRGRALLGQRQRRCRGKRCDRGHVAEDRATRDAIGAVRDHGGPFYGEEAGYSAGWRCSRTSWVDEC